jgi:hypothetical protein
MTYQATNNMPYLGRAVQQARRASEGCTTLSRTGQTWPYNPAGNMANFRPNFQPRAGRTRGCTYTTNGVLRWLGRTVPEKRKIVPRNLL